MFAPSIIVGNREPQVHAIVHVMHVIVGNVSKKTTSFMLSLGTLAALARMNIVTEYALFFKFNLKPKIALIAKSLGTLAKSPTF